MRVIFMSSGKIGLPVLKGLDNSNHEIVAVYTTPQRQSGKKIIYNDIYEYSKMKNFRILTPSSFKDDVVKNEFMSIDHDIVIVVSYGFLLPDYILHSGKYTAINVHPSALPRWRGAAPIERCVEAGDLYTEICVMFMAKKLDAGDILLRHKIEILEEMNSNNVYEIVNCESYKMVEKVLYGLERGDIKGIAQCEDGVIYASKIEKHELLIDQSVNVKVIFNKIRAFSTYGYCFIIANGERIKIISAEYDLCEVPEDKIGKVGDKFELYCKDGIIYPKKLQREGKNIVEINDFLRGWKF